MKFQFTKRSEHTTAKWAGGTTTQLAIFPASAEYTKFNFIFRLSTATVDVEESTFTFMPGVTRHLMILKGELHIDHTGIYDEHLKKFDVDVFNGEWPTTAKGKVTDFNLMTREGAEGKIAAISLANGKIKNIIIDPKQSYSALYLSKGQVEISFLDEHFKMEEGDFMLFSPVENKAETVSMNALQESEMVFAEVSI